ncbi:MAG: zinc/iron-chelating domain-containing protein [Deltaproteobacteria bacterium]|nr:MAG: zinc/iron-chelating domain-containing protein [Deltaproteobacteria bacterium]
MSSDNNSSLFFECTQCGICCQGHGGTYVNEEKIQEIADYLNISTEELKERYLTLSSSRKYMIATKEDGKCIFFMKNCTIHPVKPRMCREWPFLPAVIKVPENWEYMADACPGIKTNIDKKKLREFILKNLKQTRTMEEINILNQNNCGNK